MIDDAPTLEDYRAELTAAAGATALNRARRGDPDGFDLAVEVIRRLARGGGEFTADDVRRETLIGSNACGAAFRAAARSGLIEAVGVGSSKSPSRHGGLVHRWRGRAP